MAGWNIEWLNMNAARAYPFLEDSTRRDVNGLIAIPDSMLVDFMMVVPAPSDLPVVFVSKMLFSGNTVTLIISESGGTILTSVTALVTAPPNTRYNLVGQGDFADARGAIVFGDLSNLRFAIAEGTWTFVQAATQFESRCVRPDLRSVRMLQLVKADGSVIGPITGVVQLVEGTNCRLTFIPGVGVPSQVIIDAISGEGLSADCGCDKAYSPPPPLRTVNGVAGDGAGNLALQGTDCLQLIPGSAQITLKDICSKPCCGCTELEFLTTNMSVLQASVGTLMNQANLLQQNEINFYNSVLQSLI